MGREEQEEDGYGSLGHVAAAATVRLGSLTFSLKYKAAPPSYPAHVLKAQQCDIDAQLGPAFPNATDVIRAYPGDQGHWKREAYG